MAYRATDLERVVAVAERVPEAPAAAPSLLADDPAALCFADHRATTSLFHDFRPTVAALDGHTFPGGRMSRLRQTPDPTHQRTP